MATGNSYNWTFPRDCTADTAEYEGVGSSLKYYVLDLVDRREELTYLTLHEESGMPPAYAAQRLTDYASAGLLSREREGPAARSTFRLTSHGRSRLRYFRRQ